HPAMGWRTATGGDTLAVPMRISRPGIPLWLAATSVTLLLTATAVRGQATTPLQAAATEASTPTLVATPLARSHVAHHPPDREHAQRPRDLGAAEALWRLELKGEYLQEKLGDKPAEQIATTLTRRHQRQLSTIKSLKSDELLEIYLNALAHVYDPHSDYLGHEQMETLSIAMNLSLFGIGAALEQGEDGYTKIRELVPGGPAARGGLLKPGDRIVAVA